MAFPTSKNRTGETAKHPRPGIPLLKTDIMPLITKYQGNISRVADALGTTRHAIRRHCDNDPELGECLVSARERLIDELEESVWERAAHSQDTTLQLFMLKTQGKSRGYDQSEAQHAAKDIATAAFDFILSKQAKTIKPA